MGGVLAPGAGVEGAPGEDRELYALAAGGGGGGAVDAGPGAEAAAGQLPLGFGELLDDGVVVGEAQAAAVLEDEGESECLGGGGGEDEEGVAVLAVVVEAGGAEVGVGAEGPGDEGGEGGGGVRITPLAAWALPVPSRTARGPLPFGVMDLRGAAAGRVGGAGRVGVGVWGCG